MLCYISSSIIIMYNNNCLLFYFLLRIAYDTQWNNKDVFSSKTHSLSHSFCMFMCTYIPVVFHHV